MGDLTPEPALWHEDSGKKPWENRRNNHQGAVSSRQLGDAAHRLVANSLQMKTNRNINGGHYSRPPYATSHNPTYPSNQTNGHHGQEHSYKQTYASSSTRHPHNQHHPPLNNRGYSAQGYYSQGSHQSGFVYQPRDPHHAIQGPTPSSVGAPFYQQGGYNNRGSYQSHGGGSYHHQNGGPPTGNPRGGRDYVRPQPFGNKFSALDKGTSRRPPQSGPGSQR